MDRSTRPLRVFERGPERAPGWAFLIAWLVNLPSALLIAVVFGFSAATLFGTALIGALVGTGAALPALGVVTLIVLLCALLNRSYGAAVWAVSAIVAERTARASEPRPPTRR